MSTEIGLVDGVGVDKLYRPTSREELSRLLAAGDATGETVVFRTAGTKLDWGNPPERVDAVVDLSELPAEVEHAAGDLVVRTSASVRLASLQQTLALNGQRLALDEVVPNSSIGGVISTGCSGPLRLGFGSVRDLLIGITVVRADGVVAHSGGRVVKNVAGYDLGKLFTSSYGTLGAVVEAYFRLHPLPEACSYLESPVLEATQAASLAGALMASQEVPAAIELARECAGEYRLTVLLEGSLTSVARRAERLEQLSSHSLSSYAEPPAGFGVLPPGGVIKVTCSPGALAGLFAALEEDEATAGAVWSGSVAVGIVLLGFQDADGLRSGLATARAASGRAGGHAVVLRAPRGWREGLDGLGPLPAPDLQRALKDSFDPSHRLAPGRIVPSAEVTEVTAR